jgi:hypothetical protein
MSHLTLFAINNFSMSRICFLAPDDVQKATGQTGR